MKRCVFGVILLAGLLLSCLVTDRAGKAGPLQVSASMEGAGRAFLAEDREQGEKLYRQGRGTWYRSRPMLQHLRHEELLQDVDVLFSQLEGSLKGEDPRFTAGLCFQIRSRTEALGGRSPGTGR